MTCEHNRGGLVIVRPQEPVLYLPGRPAFFDLYSDLHVGAPTVDYARLQRDLERSRRDEARVLINGDIFDAILAKDLKRYTPGCVHPRLHGVTDIVNKALDWAAELFTPVADLIDVIGEGNHEKAIAHHHSTDMTLLLVHRLNTLLALNGCPHRIAHGGYAGFVSYSFRHETSPKTAPRPFVIFYHHGIGGGNTLGASASDLERLSFVEGADVFWMGHRHSRMNASIERVRCPRVGYEPRHREVRFVRTGAYMRPYGGQTQKDIATKGRKGNYAVDALLKPHGLGGARVVVTVQGKDHDRTMEVLQ